MTSTVRDHPNSAQLTNPTLLHPALNESHSLADTLLQIKASLRSLENNYAHLHQKWESYSHFINNTIKNINEIHIKIEEDLMQINRDRLDVIEQLKAALDSHRMRSVKEKLKKFVRPRLGVLYQHPGRLLKLHKKYKTHIPLLNTPTISIVTPSFNQGIYIEKTILSILEQNYPALEYIIQDGGSNDDTQEIIHKYNSRLKHWESKKDNGQSHALNLGFSHATGEIMAYLNSDDILLPGTLAYVANYFTANPDVDVVYGHRILINNEDQEIGRWILPPHNSKILKWADYIPQETLFWRKSIWEKVGATINENYKFAMDWELLLRFEEAGARFSRLPRFLGAFRIYDAQKTSAQIKEVGAKEMDSLRRKYHKRQVSYLEIKKNIFPYLIQHIILDKLFALGILRY